MTTIIFVLVGIILILGFLLFLLFRNKKDLKKTIAQLHNQIYLLQKNLEQLSKYLEKNTNLKIDGQKLAEEIKGAKSDEEIIDILNHIINGNNDKL